MKPTPGWGRSSRWPVSLALLLWAGTAGAEARRALLVGIDDYGSPADDLHGAVNDARAMASMLGARFGFASGDALVLENSDATRERILTELDRLLGRSARGDQAVFYYSGHGSQVRNSLAARELDFRDETIVPHPKPARADIRDKELGKMLEAAARRGVRVTAILDSCHSGSGTRGPAEPARVRAMEPDPTVDSKDASRPAPAEAGALTLSAAQEFQPAVEVYDDDRRVHGAFTLALLQALREAPVDEPAAQLFLRVRAILQRNGSTQEPALDARKEREREALFGVGRAWPGGRLAIATSGVKDGQLELQGGSAIGLAPGAVLERSGSGSALTVEVASVSLTRARAEARRGGLASVKAGQLFVVKKWAAPATASLRVHVPPARPRAEVLASAERLEPLRRSPVVAWVDDPALVSPTHVLAAGARGWALLFPDGRSAELGAAPGARAVEEALGGVKGVAGRAAPCDAKPCLYVRLPPAAELVTRLDIGTEERDAVRRVPDAEAHYVLAGRAMGGALEYAWILAAAPARPGETAPPRLPLPPRSRWVDAGADADAQDLAAGSLQDLVLRIARVRDWLTLAAPADEGAFPYRLALRNRQSGAVVRAGGTVREGEEFNFQLEARPESLAPGKLRRRYTYVLGIDSLGAVKVYFPAATGAPETQSPTVAPGASKWPASTLVGGTNDGTRVTEPFGKDTYILLSTPEAIPGIRDVEQDAVMKGAGEERGAESPLSRLLRGTGARKRGGKPLVTDVDWSIDRLEVESRK